MTLLGGEQEEIYQCWLWLKARLIPVGPASRAGQTYSNPMALAVHR